MPLSAPAFYFSYHMYFYFYQLNSKEKRVTDLEKTPLSGGLDPMCPTNFISPKRLRIHERR
jgi:hypothetical protein